MSVEVNKKIKSDSIKKVEKIIYYYESFYARFLFSCNFNKYPQLF